MRSQFTAKRLKILTAIAYLTIASFGSLAHAKQTIQFKRDFERNVLKGCLLSKPSNANVNNHRAYCQCYSSKVSYRYNNQQISQILDSMPLDQALARRVVTAFMSPEIESCKRLNLIGFKPEIDSNSGF